MVVGADRTTTLTWEGVVMQSLGHKVEIVYGILDRACIYVLVCIDAPGRGQHYCILHLFILSRVIVYP